MELNSSSTLGSLAKSALSWKLRRPTECIQIVKPNWDSSSPNLYGLYILDRAQFEREENTDVEGSASEAVRSKMT